MESLVKQGKVTLDKKNLPKPEQPEPLNPFSSNKPSKVSKHIKAIKRLKDRSDIRVEEFLNKVEHTDFDLMKSK